MEIRRLDYYISIHKSWFYQGPRPHVSKRTGLTISVGGRPVPFQTEPFTLAGHTLCQIRPLGEAMGASVSWDQNAHMVTFSRGSRTARCQVGSEVGVVNGEGYWLEQPPMFIGESVVVPLRFVAEALGYQVDWHEPASQITLTRRAR